MDAPPNGPVVTQHEVTVNGVAVGTLRGYPTNWWTTRLNLPVTALSFPTQAAIGSVPTLAGNTVSIAIDTTGVGARGCLSVAWARLHIKALSPVVLVHGNGSNGAFFVRQGLVAGLTGAGVLVCSKTLTSACFTVCAPGSSLTASNRENARYCRGIVGSSPRKNVS